MSHDLNDHLLIPLPLLAEVKLSLLFHLVFLHLHNGARRVLRLAICESTRSTRSTGPRSPTRLGIRSQDLALPADSGTNSTSSADALVSATSSRISSNSRRELEEIREEVLHVICYTLLVVVSVHHPSRKNTCTETTTNNM